MRNMQSLHFWNNCDSSVFYAIDILFAKNKSVRKYVSMAFAFSTFWFLQYPGHTFSQAFGLTHRWTTNLRQTQHNLKWHHNKFSWLTASHTKSNVKVSTNHHMFTAIWLQYTAISLQYTAYSPKYHFQFTPNSSQAWHKTTHRGGW